MTGEALSMLCGVAFRIIMECYAVILEVIATVFKMDRADEKLKNKISYAKMLPFTNSQQDVERIGIGFWALVGVRWIPFPGKTPRSLVRLARPTVSSDFGGLWQLPL